MKNKLVLVLLVIAACAFVACNETTPECKYHRETWDLSTAKSERNWEFDQNNREFFCYFTVPQLTPFIYNYGNWSISREYNKGYNNAYQALLPLSHFKSDTLEEQSVVYYTQYIDYRIGAEYVEIQVTNSDYLYAPTNPETMDFRLQVGPQAIALVVNQEDWKFDNQARQYYARFDVPEIPADVFKDGQWSIHRVYNMNTMDAFQVQLPMSCFMTDTVTNKSVVNYTEHIDYRVGIGFVEISLRNSDHLYVTDPSGQIKRPEDMDFRLQLIY